MYDLARIRYVTEHYRDLQGLSQLPFSLWFLAWAGYDLGWVRPSGWLANEYLLFPASWAVTMVLMWQISRLYERAFGWIAPERQPKRKASRRASYVFAAAFMAPIALKNALPGMSTIGLLGAVLSLYVWLDQGRREARHYLVLGILLTAMSLAPLLDGTFYPSATARDAAIKLVAAAGVLVVGTIDHLTLVRTLGPVRQEEEIRA